MSSLLLSANASEYGIVKFMEYVASQVKKGDVVLDAGAGLCPYRKYFKHTIYESADNSGKHTIVCDLEHISVSSCHYDVVISTQVLEHVEYPLKILTEFHRILKQNGKLFLTAPQGFGVHSEANYFNFLGRGLGSLFAGAGFKVQFIKPMGGIFWMMGKYCKVLPWYIFRQYLNTDGDKVRMTVKALPLAPLFILSVPICCYIIPWVCFCLDWLDRKKDWTINYACYAVKS